MPAGLRRLRSLQVPTGVRRAGSRGPELGVIAALLLVGALLRPVAGATAGPIAVAPQEARSAVTLYFATAPGNYLVPITRRVPEGEATPERALAELLLGPQAAPELRSTFAAGARVLAYESAGGRAVVDLSAGSLDGVDPRRAVKALVLTLTEGPLISSVEVSVGGKSVDTHGVAVSVPAALQRPSVNPETPGATAGGFELHFAFGSQDQYLIPVTREAPMADRTPAAAMAELLAGPRPGSGLRSALPLNVGLRSARLEGGLAIVDFDSHFRQTYRLSQANVEFVRRAVIATLTRLPGVAAGVIEIEGSRLIHYACPNVTQELPQARPWAINDEFSLAALDPAEPGAGTVLP